MAASLIAKIRDFVFPLECLACGQEGSYCCPGCLARPRPFGPCEVEDAGLIESVIAGYPYADPLIRRIIADWKFERYACAEYAALRLLDRWLEKFGRSLAPAIVVPVPLHPRRMKERGFNQAAIMARVIAAKSGGRFAEALRRERKTELQTETDDRAFNVGAAFRVSPGFKTAGRDILLVDDIWTTGSTLRECARTLKTAGARRVSAFVLSAVTPRHVDPEIRRQVMSPWTRLKSRLRSALLSKT
jgi:ComF family protein